jgi:hypothetical protein
MVWVEEMTYDGSTESILECVREVSAVDCASFDNIPGTARDIHSIDTSFALASATVIDCNHAVDVGDAASLSLRNH